MASQTVTVLFDHLIVVAYGVALFPNTHRLMMTHLVVMH